MDHGREFFLTLFMQEKLAGYRNNTAREPYLQTWLIVLFPLITQLLADNIDFSVSTMVWSEPSKNSIVAAADRDLSKFK